MDIGFTKTEAEQMDSIEAEQYIAIQQEIRLKEKKDMEKN